LGFGKSIARSTIAEANEKRNYKIFEHFAYELIQEAQKITVTNDDFNLPIKENVYAFDSSVIDLCLNVFWWATFRRAKGAIKLHTLLDLKTTIPVFVHISEASKHDVKVLDMLTFEPGGYYVMDRGYIDFERINKIDDQNAFFVIRAKNNLRFIRISSQKADKENGLLLGIALANLCYCFITFFLVVYYFEKLTLLGVTYFVAEIVVVLALVFVELSTVRKWPDNHNTEGHWSI
jgi:hypothetical protein